MRVHGSVKARPISEITFLADSTSQSDKSAVQRCVISASLCHFTHSLLRTPRLSRAHTHTNRVEKRACVHACNEGRTGSRRIAESDSARATNDPTAVSNGIDTPTRRAIGCIGLVSPPASEAPQNRIVDHRAASPVALIGKKLLNFFLLRSILEIIIIIIVVIINKAIRRARRTLSLRYRWRLQNTAPRLYAGRIAERRTSLLACPRGFSTW